jgi:hypothetical protein
MTWPVPTPAELAEYTGRPLTSYTSYVNSALLQATMMFTILSELSADDYAGMNPDYQALANFGIMAMADWLYLRWPYQQVIASPLQNETIGSYSYSKPLQEAARNAQAVEVTNEQTGVAMFDLAIRRLARRQSIGGLYFGQVTGFEKHARSDEVRLHFNERDGRYELVGPADRDQYDFPGGWAISAEAFPADPS